MRTVETPAWGGNGVIVDDLDEDAVRANLDALAQQFLSISGPEFLHLCELNKFGELEQCPGFAMVLAVATLLD